jgi:HK97 family phage portal protein
MGLMQALEKRSNLATPEKWLVDYFSGGGIETSAGVRVTSSTAMYFVAVYACINILSRTVGSLPLYLYKRLPNGGKEKARKHPLFNLIRYMPNPEMTAMRYRSTLQGHLASWGNQYSYIDWSNSGYPKALWPLRPDRVQVQRIGGKLKYSYFPGSDDLKPTESFEIPNGFMLHIPGFGYDGVIGYSPITLAREAIGLGMATEEFGARFFGQGINPGIIVEHPQKLKFPDDFRKAFKEAYAGLGKSHQTLLLEEGMKASKISIDPKDSQFLETRKFQINEIARLFLVPPHMIADLDRSTNNNIEHQGIEFVVNTMLPWFTLWEQEYSRTLLREDEREEYFFAFDVDALTRGDLAAQTSYFTAGRQWGWLCADDIRETKNMNPLPDGQGKIFVMPLNMIPASEVGKVPETPPATPPIQKNSLIYRSRLESAYVRMITDAIGRVTRQEAQRVNWLRKNKGDIDEFYREFPEYIRKQALPVFLSFGETVLSMEVEVNGLKYDDFKAEMERFIENFLENFSQKYIEASRKIDQKGLDWIERDAITISETLVKQLSGDFLNHFQALMVAK